VGGDGARYLVGAIGGHVDVEVEEFVDPALVLGGGGGEAGGGLLGEVFELGQVGAVGAALSVPGVELCEVTLECDSFVADSSEGFGELGVGDLLAGVGADHSGFFEGEHVETVTDRGALGGSDRRVGEAGVDVGLGGLSEAVGAGEQRADLTPDACFELVGVDLSGVVGAADRSNGWCRDDDRGRGDRSHNHHALAGGTRGTTCPMQYCSDQRGQRAGGHDAPIPRPPCGCCDGRGVWW